MTPQEKMRLQTLTLISEFRRLTDAERTELKRLFAMKGGELND